MQQFHLISHVLCPYVQRSIITLEEKAIPYSRTNIDLNDKPAWFIQQSPMGKVPVLQVDQQRILFESSVICEYLNEVTPGSLHPNDTFARAYHRAWIEFGSGLLNTISQLYNAKTLAEFERHVYEIQQKLQLLERQASGKHFFAGDKFHMIDAVYGPIFRYFDVFDTIIELSVFDNLPKVQQWRSAVRQRESVQQAVAPDYSEQLLSFLKKRSSYISELF
ncbi:MAG: glutathione S-transferase family protein [Arenicella sp.]